MLRATTACAFSTSGLWTSKSGLKLACFVHFDLEMCFAPQRRPLFPHLNCQKWSEAGVLCTFDLEMCFVPQRRALFRHLDSGPQKVVRSWRALYIVHFDLEMCFVPQRRPLFPHLNCQKWSEAGVLCTF